MIFRVTTLHLQNVGSFWRCGGGGLALIKNPRAPKIQNTHPRCNRSCMPRSKKHLTPKMRKAIEFYAQDPNKSKVEAYRHGYDKPDLPQKAASARACQLFKHPLVAEAVEEINAKAAEKTSINAAWVLQKLKLLAEFNINKFIVIRGDKAYYDFSQATDDDWYCISEYSKETVTKAVGEGLIEVDKIKLKSNCKLTALRLAGQHVGVGAFQQEQRDAAAGAEAVAEALQNIAEKLPV